VLKLLAATLIGMATRNPLFGSFVVVVGLLFWLNLVSRLVLLAAAWAANDIDTALADLQGVVAPREAGTAAAADPDAAQGELDTPQQRVRDGLPYLGRRDTDRVNLAAGALVGAAAAMGVTAVGRTLRLLLRGGRRTS